MSEVKYLTSDEVKQWESQLGCELFHVRDKKLGSILFKLPKIHDYRSYKREVNKSVFNKQYDMHTAEENLVCSCLVHPTSAAYLEMVQKACLFGVTNKLAQKIWSLTGSDQEEDGEGKD